MREFWDHLRRNGLRPQPIPSEDTRVPQFLDVENGLAFLEPRTAEAYIDNWLQERQRPFKYAYFVRDLDEGEEGELPAGIYCNSHVYPDEWQQNLMLRSAYGTIYTSGLASHGYIRPNQHALIGISPYFLGPEAYSLLQAQIMDNNDTPQK